MTASNKDYTFQTLLVTLRRTLPRDSWLAFVEACESNKQKPADVLRKLITEYAHNNDETKKQQE
jgi:hypothetical protein